MINNNKKKIDFWFDFSNPPHVNLFRPLLSHFSSQSYSSYLTSREFVETTGLLNKYGLKYHSFGKHGGKNRISKAFHLFSRNYKLYRNLPDFKLSISSSIEAPQISWLKRNKSIIFDDNEIAPNWLYGRFVSFVFAPSVIPIENWERNGINKNKVIQYEGYKENIYIADYKPDKSFLSNIPFRNFVTVRPENVFAAYVPRGATSIVPELIKKLTKEGKNILYLPRYKMDHKYINKQDNIHIPDKPLNGLDVCYYSDAVLTGAGTFAREAAVLGTPSISFFAGEKLLTVDQSLIAKNKIFYSRNVYEIIDYLKNKQKDIKNIDFPKSAIIKKDVINKIKKIYDNIH